ncbi:hypothetical protein OGAPHI_005852 [Ogataea philodendri]|uniref:Uncharacterized protein n=2 Tax=Saccharomycotina TaxID=147537 RepID=A0A9P8T248_9ASCO|nr:uncharacterized protein OGAPHI_005852 [Ogataea philodendri]KAH3662600.1 hypothetical protein OGAPHI_005852 [Ogataea philodendri]
MRPALPTVKQSIASIAKIEPRYFVDHIRFHRNLSPEDEQTMDLRDLYSTIGDLTSRASISNTAKLSHYNELIRQFARLDFGVYSSIAPKIEQIKGSLDKDTIYQLILANPGRRWTSFELWVQNLTRDDKIRQLVLRRLVEGEKVDTEPEDKEITLSKAISIIQLDLDTMELDPAAQKLLVEAFFRLELESYVPQLDVDLDVAQDILQTETLSPKQILSLVTPTLPTSSLVKAIVPLSSLETVKYSENEKLVEKKVGYLPEMDVSKTVAEIRAKLEQVPDTEVTESSSKSLSPQTSSQGAYFKQLLGIHDALESNQDINIEDIEATAAPVSATKILLYAWNGLFDQSMDEYNEAVAKWNNDPSAVSELVYCLVLAALLNRDLQLAQFIRKRAKESNILTKPTDQRVSQMMKQYGDLAEAKQSQSQGLKPTVLTEILHLAGS